MCDSSKDLIQQTLVKIVFHLYRNPVKELCRSSHHHH